YSQNSFEYLTDGTLLTTAPPSTTAARASALMQWDPQSGQLMRNIPDLANLAKDLSDRIAPADTFRLSNDGSLVAAICKQDALILEADNWSVAAWLKTPATPKHPDFAQSIAISPDQRRVAIGTGFGYAHIFDLGSEHPVLSFNPFPGDLGFGCGAVEF